jgi:hypothetical protein
MSGKIPQLLRKYPMSIWSTYVSPLLVWFALAAVVVVWAFAVSQVQASSMPSPHDVGRRGDQKACYFSDPSTSGQRHPREGGMP